VGGPSFSVSSKRVGYSRPREPLSSPIKKTRHFDRSFSQSQREKRSGEICFSTTVVPAAQFYSARKACIGSIIEALRAGTNPATVAEIKSTTTAVIRLSGSYDRT
jgi:hypothetical protein